LWVDGNVTNISAAGAVTQSAPKVSDKLVAWTATTQDSNSEVFVYNGNNTIQLTNNNYKEKNVQVASGYVAWEGFDGNDYEIFIWDGTSVIQITDNQMDDSGVQLDTYMTGLSDGTYLIKNLSSGTYLNRDYGSTADGANVHTWECDTCSENIWNVTTLAEGGYKITAKDASWVGLDIDTESGNAQVWSYWGGGENQKFDLKSVRTDNTSYFMIDPQHNENAVIAVDPNAAGNGYNVYQQETLGTPNQQWEFIAVK